MEVLKYFPTFVATAKVADAAALNELLLREVESIRAETPNGKPSAWASDLYTTFLNRGDLHLTHPGFGRLGREIIRHTQEFADYLEVDGTQAKPVISECWLNVYGRKDTQEVHNHGGHHFSVVYYVKAPPGCGRINFYTPLIEDNFAQLPCVRASWKTRGVANVQPQDGTIVMFRSWLRHAVSPGANEGERISVAFNVLLVPLDVAKRSPGGLGG